MKYIGLAMLVTAPVPAYYGGLTPGEFMVSTAVFLQLVGLAIVLVAG